MEVSMYRQRDSAAIIICPRCRVNNWADEEAWEKLRNSKAWCICPKCGTLCEVAKVPGDLPEPITAQDLDRVALHNDLTAASASHEEFNTWAKTFIVVTGKDDDGRWTPQQRADLCDLLLMDGKITVPPKVRIPS